ncbi:Phosphatidylinositol-4-phosphate 5-kinase, N-terminal domain [Phytophthora cactorum]|nr:Phosphatidylinositol-4-phosphate 5-kinase, N-terminal domain [Phytophthora cactorum]
MADAERRVQSMPHQRLDRDPSRCGPQWKTSNNAVSSETSKPVASPVKIRPPPMSAGNQYWMPDHLCKHFHFSDAAITADCADKFSATSAATNLSMEHPTGFLARSSVFRAARGPNKLHNRVGRFVRGMDSVEVQQRFHPRVRSRRRHYSAELLDAIESGGLMEAEVLAFNKGRQNASPKKEVSTVPEETQWELAAHNSNILHTQREIALDKYMQSAHEQIRDGIKQAVSSLSNSLPESEFVDLNQLALTLEDMAFVVTGHLLFSMNFRSPSGFNYLNLVKVKSIAMDAGAQTGKKGPSYNFKWLAGTVCHKHLSHKQMARQNIGAKLTEEHRTTWCTTSTLRVRDPGSLNPRYHQCVEAKHLRITACSDEDVSFGNFLNQELAALSLKCSCRTGTITISFEELPDKNKQSLSMSLSQANDTGATDKSFGSFSELSFTMGSERDINLLALMTPNSFSQTSGNDDYTAVAAENGYPTVIFWRWCRECKGVITPFIPLEKYIYKYSFARFLEVLFSEAEGSVLPKSPSATCTHPSMESHVLFFNIGNSVARFDFSKQVSLRLGHTDLKRSAGTLRSKQSWELNEQAIVEKEVTARLGGLTELLKSLITSFTEKVQGIIQAVEAFERTDTDHHHARIILEVMCISKMVRSGDAMVSHKLTQLGKEPANSLGACDATHRALYLMACKWITCMLRLRKLIKRHVSTEAAPPAPNSGSFTLGGVTFHPTAVLTPVASPRVVEESTLTPSAIVKEPDWGEGAEPLVRRRSSGALSSVTEAEATTRNAVSSSSTIGNIESLKRPSMPFSSGANSNGDGKEGSRPGWKDALLDLYRVLGRPEPGSDFTIDLPEALTTGHPSLPHRSKSRVVLVNESQPITCVAYALSTDSYEEELDGWKLRVHSEAVESVAAQKQHLGGASTNWSRAALETTLNVPFKFAAVEMPLHLSLLSGKTSSTMSSTCWELSTIAYYPLQFEVLRELFYGSLHSFVFSISHVANWDANGGKSGASFYRTLDDRFVIKHISAKEMQSFVGCLPGYFRYMASIYFDGRASLLSKTVGLYQTTITRKDSGQKTVQYICVMENAFYQKQLTRTYDLKGSSRNRFAKPRPTSEAHQNDSSSHVLLDGNFLEFTRGHPVGVLAEDHEFILKAVENDTAFLNSINIVDYSMVMGLSYRQDNTGEKEEAPSEMTVGIIDYLRQFDLIKRVESVGKSVGMIAGQSSPTIIEPGLYGKRFRDAIHRYFMPVTPISSGTNDDK